MTILQGTSIVFDLDGTLVDTAPDLAAALNAVLTGAGRKAVPPAEVRRLVGRGARVLIEQGFRETGDPAEEHTLDTHVQSFIDYYAENLHTHSLPFPGVEETLKVLIAAGARLGVCTNKPHVLTEPLVKGLNLTQYFPSIHGAGRTSYNKPDARHILDVIAELGGTKDNAIMIGDSITDVLAARASGVPVILLTYGYTEEPAHSLCADAVTDDFRELPGLIEMVLKL